MNQQINRILGQITEDILEKLAFIFSSPEEEIDSIDKASSITGRVSFTGPFTGVLEMSISESALPELAGNMLGIDEDETTVELQQDALKELINVVCGNLLPAIAGKEIIFNVDAPQIVSSDDSATSERDVESEVKLELEEGQCDILLFLDGDIPSGLAGAE